MTIKTKKLRRAASNSSALVDRTKKHFPAELIELDQWILWRLKKRKDKPDKIEKVPYQTSGRTASVSDPATWDSFENVSQAYLNGRYSGIGFVFSESDPYVGIDFDDCISDGVIDDEVIRYIEKFDGYTERSQSGKGVHIIVIGKLPDKGRNNQKLGIEMYDKKRYFAVTGDVIK